MLNGKICALLVIFTASWSSAEPENAFSFDGALKRLGHEEFKERVAAQAELSAWGRERVDEGIRVFYELFRSHEDPEIRMRCRELLKELVVMTLAKEGEGYIGVRMMDQPIGLQGQQVRNAVRITEVMPGTPAQRAKLQAGDLVTGIDDMQFGQATATIAFGDYVRSKKPQQTVTLHLLRQEQPMKLKVELMKRPPGLDQRLFFPLGEDMLPPDQKTVEEDEFREWLKKKAAEKAEGRKSLPEPE